MPVTRQVPRFGSATISRVNEALLLATFAAGGSVTFIVIDGLVCVQTVTGVAAPTYEIGMALTEICTAPRVQRDVRTAAEQLAYDEGMSADIQLGVDRQLRATAFGSR